MRRQMRPHLRTQCRKGCETDAYHSHSHNHIKIRSGLVAPADASSEDWFWSRLKSLETKGISRSQCTKLLKLTGNDFTEANRVLDQAEGAKTPQKYLGATIRNMEMAGRTMPAGQNPHVPAWVNEQRASGVPVERRGQALALPGRTPQRRRGGGRVVTTDRLLTLGIKVPSRPGEHRTHVSAMLPHPTQETRQMLIREDRS